MYQNNENEIIKLKVKIDRHDTRNIYLIDSIKPVNFNLATIFYQTCNLLSDLSYNITLQTFAEFLHLNDSFK